jgi:hypothetical protein
MNHSLSNPTGGQPEKGASKDLTCSEGQIEELLSEGESTEIESEEEEETSGKPVSNKAPGHRQT